MISLTSHILHPVGTSYISDCFKISGNSDSSSFYVESVLKPILRPLLLENPQISHPSNWPKLVLPN